MRKTTVSFARVWKERLGRAAKGETQSQAGIIRAALESLVTGPDPRPTVPLFHGEGTTNIAEGVDDALGRGFGRT